MYGVVSGDGSICFGFQPRTSGGTGCVEHVGARGAIGVDRGDSLNRANAYGIVDNAVSAVRVRAGRQLYDAFLGRNAFYLKLPLGVVWPRQIEFRTRSGEKILESVPDCGCGAIVP